jgi:formate/nitrite transporter FocA (FNT family)
MAVAPTPAEIFRRAAGEGERRLNQSMLELTATGFIAGVTIVFAVIALAVVHAAVEPRLGEAARVAGALAFAGGFIFLIVGRSELFTENFFDPAATAFERRERGMLVRLLRLWMVTLALNLLGGGLFAVVVSVRGVLPEGAGGALRRVAEEIAARGAPASFVSAIVGGALVALLSFLLQAVDSVGSRIAVAYAVGFLLAVGPFDHVVVTALHLFLGILFGASTGYATLATVAAVAAAGNLVGGVGLVTLSHVAQARGARESGG